jgi:viroplasmin and RNaseH domain-containing protein
LGSGRDTGIFTIPWDQAGIQVYLPYLGTRQGYRYIYHTLRSGRDTGIFTIHWDQAGIQVHISTSLSINVCKDAIYIE